MLNEIYFVAKLQTNQITPLLVAIHFEEGMKLLEKAGHDLSPQQRGIFLRFRREMFERFSFPAKDIREAQVLFEADREYFSEIQRYETNEFAEYVYITQGLMWEHSPAEEQFYRYLSTSKTVVEFCSKGDFKTASEVGMNWQGYHYERRDSFLLLRARLKYQAGEIKQAENNLTTLISEKRFSSDKITGLRDLLREKLKVEENNGTSISDPILTRLVTISQTHRFDYLLEVLTNLK